MFTNYVIVDEKKFKIEMNFRQSDLNLNTYIVSTKPRYT